MFCTFSYVWHNVSNCPIQLRILVLCVDSCAKNILKETRDDGRLSGMLHLISGKYKLRAFLQNRYALEEVVIRTTLSIIRRTSGDRIFIRKVGRSTPSPCLDCTSGRLSRECMKFLAVVLRCGRLRAYRYDDSISEGHRWASWVVYLRLLTCWTSSKSSKRWCAMCCGASHEP